MMKSWKGSPMSTRLELLDKVSRRVRRGIQNTVQQVLQGLKYRPTAQVQVHPDLPNDLDHDTSARLDSLVDSDVLFTGDWKCVAASAVGTMHAKTLAPCQDAFRERRLQNGLLLMAVADGAGSAEFSADGAETAVSVALASMEEELRISTPTDKQTWIQVMTVVFQKAGGGVSDQAQSHGASPREYASTLLVVAASDNWIVSGMVGDGALVLLDRSNALQRVTTPQRGEYANATNFITGTHMLQHLAVEYRQMQVKGIAVLTDGLLNLSISFPDNEPFAGFFGPLFRYLDASVGEPQAAHGLQRFLMSDRVNRRTDDDKTLLLALRTFDTPCKEAPTCDLKPPMAASWS